MVAQINLRKPVVSGQFYPDTVQGIRSMISPWVDQAAQKMDVIGAVLPHAGYQYSGRVAAETVSGVKIKDTVVLLGPNHTGQGATFSIMPQGSWRTPLGDLAIDAKLASLFLKESSHLEPDTLAHLEEHSLEVQLPFLQYFKSDFKIVPLAIKTDDLKLLQEVGGSLARVINKNNLAKSVLLIASSDLTHYQPQEVAEKKDRLALEAILELNELKLISVVKKFDISMCGFAPVAVLISAAKSLNARQAKLIKYQTSGQVTHDFSSVVGYAGITIY